jgi:hypothetical protein
VTATVTDLGSGPSPAQLSSPIDTSSATAGSVPFIGHDVAGNATSVDCPYTVADDVTAPTKPTLTALKTFTTKATALLKFTSSDGASGSGVAS